VLSDTSKESIYLEENLIGEDGTDGEDDTLMVSLVTRRKTELISPQNDGNILDHF
jgi:hypothetical protein